MNLLSVSLAIAVVVPGVENVGRGKYETPPAVAGHRGRPAQAAKEDNAPVDPAVGVGVLEQPDPAGGLTPGQLAGGQVVLIRGEGIVPHLDYVQVAELIEGHRDRIDHMGFAGRQLQAETLGQAEPGERVFGLRGGDARQQSGELFTGFLLGSQEGPGKEEDGRHAPCHQRAGLVGRVFHLHSPVFLVKV